MRQLRLLRCVLVTLLIIVHVMRINSRAVSFSAYSGNDSDTR